ncbi:MAG: coproporphyrinogen III oxidase family protein [Desulfomonile tiedjei]|nr:coproporphyrinogen III oxidase family protein [Desulfomonile tiedjei]
MMVEAILTAFLKRRFSNVLQLEDFGRIAPPRPKAGKEYLLYVHVPFCEELCPYCSFNRFPLEKDLARTYFRSLGREIRMYAELGFDFPAIYVGGGTPTVLPDEIARILDDLRSLFRVREISLETNPHHLTDDIVRVLKDCGVNRLSVGVQSFDDSLLKQMERYHKYGSGRQIRDRLAHYMGTFDTLNVDMIFNFPTQTMAMLERDLDIIEEIQADQVTFYPLMVSDLTRRELASRFGPISYGQEKRFYLRLSERLSNNYTCGTAWCFSRKKSMIDEYIVDYDEYVGVGSGSFGYTGGSCYANTFSIADYVTFVEEGRFPILAKRNFTETEQIQYDFMMKLFGTSLDVEKAEKKFHGKFMKALWKEIPVFRLVAALTNDNGTLRLTRKGQYFWVIMMREFFTGVNNFRDACRAGNEKTVTAHPDTATLRDCDAGGAEGPVRLPLGRSGAEYRLKPR